MDNNEVTNSNNILGKGISGSTLKLIAIITMIIDHFAAVVIINLIQQPKYFSSFETLKNLYYISRYIGRISFPIFIFLLIEGFTHTKDTKKYAFRLFIFALISEIPFNLAIYDSYFYTKHQNIFFTLFLGVAALICFEKLNTEFKSKKFIKIILYIFISLFFMVSAKILNTDYDAIGVLAIILMYLFRSNKIKAAFASSLSLVLITASQFFSFISLIPIKLYNGKRGLNIKYIFYIFYPLHLLIFYFIKISLN